MRIPMTPIHIVRSRGLSRRKAADPGEEFWTGRSYGQYGANSRQVANPYFPAQLQLIRSADSAVLGPHGIYPVLPELPDDSDDLPWDEYPVDPLGLLMPRDYQTIILTCLILDGEAWVRVSGGGKFEPLPIPDTIRRNDETRRATQYEWSSARIPGGLVLPANSVNHYVVFSDPLQDRGYAIPEDTYRMMQNSGRLAQASIWDEMLRRFLGVRISRESGPLRTGTPPNDSRIRRKIDLSLRNATLVDLDPGDHVETLTGAPAATNPMVAQEYIAGHIASVLGLSRLALTGDAANSNFSASRVATQRDYISWSTYRRKVVQATRPVYEAYRALYPASQMPRRPRWRHPLPIAVDQVKQAMEWKILYEIGALTRDEIRDYLELPPLPPEPEPPAPPTPEE